MASATFTSTTLPADVRLMNATASLIGGIGVAVLLALALLWLARLPVFALRSIRIEGELMHNSALTIRANAAPKLAGNFFTMDLAAGRRAFESVPWVRQAVLQRVWPNRLAVRLEEHRPVALWGGAAAVAGEPTSAAMNEASDRMVDSFGEVFEANLGDIEDESLPTLRGPDGSGSQMLAMLARLRPEFRALDARIDTLELSGRGSWRAVLDTGVRIELGRGTDAELLARTRGFVGTLPELRDRYQQHPLVYADLRHRDGYAVRLRGVTTTLDAPPATTPRRDTKGLSKMSNSRRTDRPAPRGAP